MAYVGVIEDQNIAQSLNQFVGGLCVGDKIEGNGEVASLIGLLDDAAVLLAALLRAVLAEIDVAAVQPDDTQTGRGVEAVLGDSGRLRGGHVAAPSA
jgi:hypothetical protein